LPTFQRETRATLVRLDAFANNANPLVNQLRPAARELSPTLLDLKALSPDLRALLRDLGPIIQASRAGLPAINTTLDRLQPVLGQLDPFLRQLNPALRFIGLYRRELNSFFTNSVASTEAFDFPTNAVAPVHYLRTTNPVNLENLAVYKKRLASNRNKTYFLPGDYDRLARGLTSTETRQCGTGLRPTLLPANPGSQLSQILKDPSNTLTTLADNFFGSISAATNGTVPAPKCVQQPKVGPRTRSGTGMVPHVEPDPAYQR
jgi:hypothetical protein